MTRLAFIGLGVMGYPMAGHLARAGHEVCVYNRTTARAESWCETYGGSHVLTPAAAADGAETVFLCVGNDADVRDVMLGEDGVLAGTSKGSVVVDHTTASAALARELHETCANQGVRFLDAPVSGGQAGAENGTLSIMVGGDEDTVRDTEPLLDVYAGRVTHIGGPGCGQLAKMANQVCIAGIVQGLSEALHFAQRADLDVESVIQAISGGAAQSWQMDNRWKTMIANEFDFGFAVDWMRKDLGLVMDEAARNGAELEMTRLVDSFYAEIQAMGGGRWDTSSLIARLEKS